MVYGAILLLASTDFNTLIIQWNGELLQRNCSSLIRSIRVSCYKTAAASLTATDPVHRHRGHILLQISVSDSLPVLQPPLPAASSLHAGCKVRRCISGTRNRLVSTERDWKRAWGFLDQGQLLSKLAKQLEGETESELKMAYFSLKSKNRQVGQFLNSSAVHTITCALPQTHTNRILCVV